MGQTLQADREGDRFGWYVLLSDDGRTVDVGAKKQGDPDNKFDAGYVRVFTYNGTRQLGSNNSECLKLGVDLEGEAIADEFGKPIALFATGRRLAVGARPLK
jgi:hypothetical protein